MFCAGPSLGWAVISGVGLSGARCAAMLAGFVTFIVAYSLVTSRPFYLEHVETKEVGWVLWIAVFARAAIAPLMFFGPDMLLGLLAIDLTRSLAHLFGHDDFTANPGFGCTYLTTLIQGALISLTILFLAGWIGLVRAAFRRWRRTKQFAAGV